MTTTSNFAIYNRPGRKYIVKRFDPALPDLWAQLGSNYDREMAQKLADSLTRDEESNRHEAKARRLAKAYGASDETITQIADRERARSAGEQDRRTGSTEAD